MPLGSRGQDGDRDGGQDEWELHEWERHDEPQQLLMQTPRGRGHEAEGKESDEWETLPNGVGGPEEDEFLQLDREDMRMQVSFHRLQESGIHY